jgi:hypothetical protein
MARILVFGVLGFALVFGPALTQNNAPREIENEEYVYTQFRAAFGEFPRLGWALPGGIVAAENRAPKIAIFSDSGTIEAADLKATLSSDESLKFAREKGIDCEASLEQKPAILSLYRSAIQLSDHNAQVLFINTMPKDARGGFQRSPLDHQLGAEVWKRMRAEAPGQPRNSVVIRQEGTAFFYSLAATYQGDNQEVSRIGVFLHSAAGQVVAADITDINGEWCDGCAVPTARDGIDVVFAVVNLYMLPRFLYPVLMLDTSTVEGRSLTLATFSPDRRYSSHLFYEYVVNCGHPVPPSSP